MAPVLRRKLICFYCNCHSAQDRRRGLQQWQCENCDAVNHLDQNGEITDPPNQETSSSVRYARPRPRSLSPVSDLQRSLFCQRCVQNQHIVNQALAEYLPSQDDPRYADFERRLPGYRRKMETDFPQVCENCAPAVADRIRATGYAAKADHLRRMMDRTRGTSMRHRSWTWKRLAVLLGAIGWSTGLLGQLSWNILGTLPTIHAEDGLVNDDQPQSVAKCFIHGTLNLQPTSSCTKLIQPLMLYALALSFLCFWWHPRMQYKLRGAHGRIVGHVEFYKLQLILLVIRVLAWKLIGKVSAISPGPQAARAVHAFSLVVGVILTILSFNAIQVDQRPLVSFQENHEPLISPRAGRKLEEIVPQIQRDPNPPLRRHTKPFSIEKLAPTPQQLPYQPPTPPPEEDDEESTMEWTPQHQFQPPLTYRAPKPKPTFDEPSPFHGVIPAAPVSWAQRLRNPPNQLAFHKAPEAKKESFFSKGNKRMVSDAASDATSPAPSVTHDSMFDMDSPVKFAAPRFFAPADRMETGLESLFGDAFSLGKEKSSTGLPGQQDNQIEITSSTSNTLSRLLITLALGASCVAWDYASGAFTAFSNSTRFISILVAGLFTTYNLASEFPRADRNLGYIVLQVIRLLIAGVIARATYVSLNSDNEDQLATFGLWYLIALTVLEGWAFVSSLAAPPDIAPVEVLQPPDRDNPVPEKAPNESFKELSDKSLTADTSSSLSRNAKSNSIQLSQRTTRSKARSAARRDSLGVDHLGSLSLGGW